MDKRELKEKAFELRKQGKSYNQIIKEINVSKGALSYWLNGKTWSKSIELQNRGLVSKQARLRIIKINEGKKAQRGHDRAMAIKEAGTEFELYKNEPLFVGGLMVYLGEGDKSLKNGMLRVSNIDAPTLVIFKRFLIKYCDVQEKGLRAWVLCYPDHDTERCLEWWSNNLEITEAQFYKTQVIKGKHKVNRLIYGVGNITITKALLKVKILRWIDLMSEYLSRP